MSTARLEKLPGAPITEVICGFVFAPIAKLDGLTVAPFFEKVRSEFPKHQFQNGVIANSPDPLFGFPFPNANLGSPNFRLWLLSDDESLVIQLQKDRLYLNWRAKGGTYPRFSPPGALLDKVMDLYGKFVEFIKTSFNEIPVVAKLELGKIDRFVKGQHWSDRDDLGAMIPHIKPFVAMTTQPLPPVFLKVTDQSPNGNLDLTLSAFQDALAQPFNGGVLNSGIQLETQIQMPLIPGTQDFKELFRKANDKANEIFMDLIPESERRGRFS